MIQTKLQRLDPLHRPCPLCGSRVGRNLADLHFEVFHNSPISGSFSLVICDRCGLAFFETSSTQADFNLYYQENGYYYSASTAGSGGSSQEEILRYQAIAQRLAAHLPHKHVALFDVGCGKGGLLAVLAQNGFQRLFGVDMLPTCVEHVRKTLGLVAETGSVSSLPFPMIRADVLIYSHVVEHVLDLPAMMKAAFDKLNDQGLLYVEVPDAARYAEASDWPYQAFYLEHVNHFDAAGLTNLFTSNGFSPVSQGTYHLNPGIGLKVPCLWAVFRKGGQPTPWLDSQIEKQLLDYLLWSAEHPALKRLEHLAEERKPLYLWGISQYAMLLLGTSALRRCNLRGLIDRDPYKQSQSILGLPVQSPLTLRKAEPDQAVLITALGYEEKIKNHLREMGFPGMVWTMSGELDQ
ncbi:MAG: class I SAM-dependent methyltransferase [Deltaproteobacteria bacterium]|nr:class I SAM-dependent methyltransferase [Deltaproteobacteria bacterium]